ncbi:MAG TPA: PrgI family protein [Patescibacteria group bacterium]|nr:PrgI family protein [Patescibacteria group bacterium]
MQQFVVPQFIDIENKIMGPITTRQFVLMIAWIGLEFGAFKLFDIAGFALASVPMFIIFFPVIFLKFNGKPFHYLVASFIANKKKPQIRIWSNLYRPPKYSEARSSREIRDEKKREHIAIFAAKSTKPSKLSELTLIVDTGGVYEGEQTSLEIEQAFESIEKKKP